MGPVKAKSKGHAGTAILALGMAFVVVAGFFASPGAAGVATRPGLAEARATGAPSERVIPLSSSAAPKREERTANRTNALAVALAGAASLPTLRFRVVSDELRPFSWVENGRVVGNATEIVRAVLDPVLGSGGYALNVIPWPRAYNMALTEPNTLIYALYRTPQREKRFQWIARLGKAGTSRLYRLKRRADVEVKGLEDLRGSRYRIATLRAGMDHFWLEDKGLGALLFLAPDFERGLELLEKGRVDLASFNDLNLDAELARTRRSRHDLEPVLPLFEAAPYLAAGPHVKSADVEKLRASYERLIREGLEVP